MTLHLTPELCDTCGSTPEDCKNNAVEATTDWAMIAALASTLPSELAEPIDRVLTDWRTHVLPACNPIAID
jgi:hypothetical protein